MIPENILKEAQERGLVPGVEAESPWGSEFVIPPYDKWLQEPDGSIQYYPEDNTMYFIYCPDEGWATPVAPSLPSPSIPRDEVVEMVKEMIEARFWNTIPTAVIRSIAKKHIGDFDE